jgi:hypothetical protein
MYVAELAGGSGPDWASDSAHRSECEQKAKVLSGLVRCGLELQQPFLGERSPRMRFQVFLDCQRLEFVQEG